MKTALYALLFACALITTSASYAQTSSTPQPNAPAATTSGYDGSAHRHAGPCHEDVKKFCSNVQRSNGGILNCLKQNEANLSPPCEAGMKRHASGQQPAPAAFPPSTTPPAK